MTDRRMFIPTVSPLVVMIGLPIPKGAAPVQFMGFWLCYFIAPLNLKENDLVMVDPRSNRVEAVERDGIMVWRDVWKN